MIRQQDCNSINGSDATQLISFCLSDVPIYLQKSDFYASLEDDGEEIALPAQYFKSNCKVSSPEGARHLLSTMRFWGVNEIPSELIMYVVKSPHQDMTDILSDFAGELKVAEFLHLLNLELHQIRLISYDKYVYLSSIIRMETTVKSAVAILACQFEHYRGQIWNEETMSLASQLGWLDCLVYLHEMGCPWDASTCAGAAKMGHLDCLQYAHAHGCPWDAQTTGQALKHRKTACFKYALSHGCPCDTSTCTAAAQYGDLSLLTLAHEHGCPWDESTCAAGAFSLPCLMYAHEQGCPWDKSTCAAAAFLLPCLTYAHEQGCPWDGTTCSNAALCGALQCLMYAHENGCPWDASTCSSAAAHGRLECLTYAHEQGCPWDENTCAAAAHQESSTCLVYAHTHGCPWGEEVIQNAASYGRLECLRYALKNGCPGREVACKSVKDSLECLKYLCEEQLCPRDTRIIDRYVSSYSSNSIGCLQYCLEQGYLADEDTMRLSVHSIEKLKMLHSHGCPWDKRTMHAAAEMGKLESLQFCIEHGCPGQEDVVLAAAAHLPLLQYLHAQGCPLLPDAYKEALRAVRPMECVRFLFETGDCPWPPHACTWFVQHRRMDCLRYAHTHGAPWDAAACAAAARAGVHEEWTLDNTEEKQQHALDFLCYLHEKGCPWDVSTMYAAEGCSNLACAQYAAAHGCPTPRGLLWAAVAVAVAVALVLLLLFIIVCVLGVVGVVRLVE